MPQADDLRVPLVVDLDGTLHDRDCSVVDFVRAVRRRPWALIQCGVWWLSGGRSRVKTELAKSSSLSCDDLNLDARVLTWLREEKAAGRTLVLATGTDERLAERLVQPLDLFEAVMGTHPGRNLVAGAKAQRLVDAYGERGFDYAGNSRADLAVWPRCRKAIVVSAPPGVARRAVEISHVDRVFGPVKCSAA